MKRAIMVLAVLTLVAFAGDFATGGAELTKFKGYGTFRWTMYGEEDADPSNEFSDYVWMAWVPKINDNLDFCVSAKHTQMGGFDFDAMYLNMYLTDGISVMGGQFKRPFGYAYTRSGGSMYFADRSMITVNGFGSEETRVSHFEKFGGLDTGAMATVEFAPVTVDLMISNGTGANAAANPMVKKQFTARLAVDPTEWLTLGGSFAMVGTPESEEPADADAVSATGMDFFAVADYPVSSTGTLRFVGEYMILGADDNMDDAADGNGMSVMAGYNMDLDGEVLVSVMPAVRYDAVTPIDNTGEAEDNGFSRIDFCVNLGLFSNLNTLQVGMSNYGAEAEGFDSYTDIYANWRMNF